MWYKDNNSNGNGGNDRNSSSGGDRPRRFGDRNNPRNGSTGGDRGGFRGGSSSTGGNGGRFNRSDDRGGFRRPGGMMGGRSTPPVVYIDLINNGILPKYGTEGSAGADLHALNAITIHSQSEGTVSTGVKLILPNNRMIAEIRSRSSMAKNGLIILTSHIDFSENNKEIEVTFFNLSNKDITINGGDKIAQIVFNNISRPDIEIKSALDATERNEGGFGSTGR